MKKGITVVAAILATLFLLVSCEGLFGGNSDDQKEQQKDKVYKRIVYSSSELDLFDARAGIIKILGYIGMIEANFEAEIDGEIVFGATDRKITADAAAELNKRINDSNDYDSGYIIYSKGNNVAVYWTSDDMADTAINAFIKECINGSQMKIEDGVIAAKLYVEKEFIMKGRWDSMEEEYGKDLTSAIRSLYNFFDGHKMSGWIANLYDPVTGGFYYSRSARDYDGFLPDLESTVQALGILESLGALNPNEVFPDELKIKIVNFARNMQSSENGYFLHPQWSQNIEELAVDRYGRDSGNATAIIGRFTFDTDGDGVPDKQYPKYCAPDGTKCALHDGTDDTCSFPVVTGAVTGGISTKSSVSTVLSASSVSGAVYKVVNSTVTPTAVDSSHPDYSSAAAFKAWLETYNSGIGTNSGEAHKLAALSPEIANHGYADVLINHLNEHQEKLFKKQVADGQEPSGVWQSDINYRAVWGSFKYAYIYNLYNKPIKLEYASYMIKTSIAVIRIDPNAASYGYNDVTNQWSSIDHIIRNVKNHYGKDEAQKLYDLVREDPIFLVENTIEKLQPFKIDDGSFSMIAGGTNTPTIYGVPISMGGVKEGTVNSTNLLLAIYGIVCDALGCPRFSLCTAEDGAEVLETITTLEPIDKIVIGEKRHDFEKDMPVEIAMDRNNATAELAIVGDPDNDSNSVLHFFSPASSTNAGDILKIEAGGVGSSSYVFETDMYVSSESTKDANLLQIMVGGATPNYMLQLKITGNAVIIDEVSSINGDKQSRVGTVDTDTWFNLRVEYYSPTEEGDLPIIDVYIDETLVKTSSNFFGSHQDGAQPKDSFSRTQMLSLMRVNSKIYLDNVFVNMSSDTYTE